MKLLKKYAPLLLLCILLQYSLSIYAQGKKSGNAKKPFIVFVTGDHEYGGEATLPLIAAELENKYGFRTKVLKAYPDHNAEENIKRAERYYRLTQSEYNRGVKNSPDVLGASQRLFAWQDWCFRQSNYSRKAQK